MRKRFTKVLGVGVTLALLSSLLIGVVPATAVSQSTVTLSNAVISQASNYTLTFNVVGPVPNTVAGIITVQFPIGTVIAALDDGDITIQSTAGFGVANDGTAVILAANVTLTAGTATAGPSAAIKLADLTNAIGEGATVRVKFLLNKVTNPPTIADDYVLTVKTSEVGDTTAVASVAYALTAPTVPPLAGIVEVYNPSGVLMGSFTGNTAFMGAGNAMAIAGASYTIKIGPGTYTENITPSATGQTFIATGSAAETIIVGNWTVNQASTTLQGLTLKNEVGGVTNATVNITGDKSAVTDCVFTKAGAATTAVAEAAGLLALNVAAPTGNVTVTDCTFDSTLGDTTDSVIVINQDGASITGCTVTVDVTVLGFGTQDTAVTVNAPAAVATLPVLITGVTITGSSGTGIQGTLGTATITDSSLDTLDPAMNLVAGTYTIKDSTITDCGTAASATAAGRPAIQITDAGAPPQLTITNSAITGSPNDILELDATGSENSNLVTIMFNDLSGNALGIDNDDVFTVGGTVNAMLNWWGDADGPAAGANAGAVNANGFTGAATTGTLTTATASLLASATQGVDVVPTLAAGTAWAPAAASVIAVGHYPANPQSDTPEPALADGFYDVYFADTNAGAAVATLVTVKLYNDAITADTVAYVWSDLQGTWAACSSQGVNTFGGFVWIKITAAATSVPTILNLMGTEFALAETAAADEVQLAAPTVLTPVFGDDSTSLKPTFTWTASEGAASYAFVIAEEIGQDDPFAIIDYSASTDTHGHVARETLKYSTVYNWRVKAVHADDAALDSLWTTGFFTTMDEPEPEPEPVPPVVIKETPPTPAPEIILEVPPAVEKTVQVIPDVLLYVVIAVAAVLIIAVIVLIMRTRRVA